MWMRKVAVDVNENKWGRSSHTTVTTSGALWQSVSRREQMRRYSLSLLLSGGVGVQINPTLGPK